MTWFNAQYIGPLTTKNSKTQTSVFHGKIKLSEYRPFETSGLYHTRRLQLPFQTRRTRGLIEHRNSRESSNGDNSYGRSSQIWDMFRRYPVRISAGAPAIRTETSSPIPCEFLKNTLQEAMSPSFQVFTHSFSKITWLFDATQKKSR
jgi:hypothetical protein